MVGGEHEKVGVRVCVCLYARGAWLVSAKHARVPRMCICVPLQGSERTTPIQKTADHRLQSQ